MSATGATFIALRTFYLEAEGARSLARTLPFACGEAAVPLRSLHRLARTVCPRAGQCSASISGGLWTEHLYPQIACIGLANAEGTVAPKTTS